MTREEAITYLKVIWNRYKAEYEIERETLDAYNMAIEALQTEAVPIEKYHELQHQFVMLGATFADLTEVVRCKDCRYKYEEGDCTHYYWCRLHDRPVDDTDYCSWGEESEVEG